MTRSGAAAPARLPGGGTAAAAGSGAGAGESTTETAADRTWAWLILAATLALVLFIRVRQLDVPLERDEGEYAYAGQLILQGVPPYSDAFNMKLPGTYYAYAVSMAVFGQSIRGVHVGLMLVSLATAVLLFLLARRPFGSVPAAVGASLFAMLALSPDVYGFAAHATHFVALPAAVGTLLLVQPAPLTHRRAALSGLVLGLAFLAKQQALPFVLFGILFAAWRAHRDGRVTPRAGAVPPRAGAAPPPSGAVPTRAGNAPLPTGAAPPPSGRAPSAVTIAAAVLGAAVLPYALLVAYLWSKGVTEAFWFWTVTYAREYATRLSLEDGWYYFRKAIVYVTGWNLPAVLLAACGAVRLWRARSVGFPQKAFLFGFFAAGCLATAPGLYFRYHYFIVLLPALGLLAGAAVRGLRPWVAAGILAATLLTPLAGYAGPFFAWPPEQMSRVLYRANPFADAPELARIVAQNTAPGERIAILGSEPEILFYARRRSVIPFIYAYAFTEPHPYALKLQQDAIRQVEAARPRIIVAVRVFNSWLPDRKAPQYILEWMERYLPDHYDIIASDVIGPDGTSKLTVGPEARLATGNYILVMRRRD